MDRDFGPQPQKEPMPLEAVGSLAPRHRDIHFYQLTNHYLLAYPLPQDCCVHTKGGGEVYMIHVCFSKLLEGWGSKTLILTNIIVIAHIIKRSSVLLSWEQSCQLPTDMAQLLEAHPVWQGSVRVLVVGLC